MARSRRPKPCVLWPSWRYGPEGQAEIFESPDDVPLGWSARPDGDEPEITSTPIVLDRAQIIEDLAKLGHDADPRWSVVRLNEHLETLK